MKNWFLSILLIGCLFGSPQTDQSQGSLASVNTVYVGSMGQSDEAERFRMLLEEELNKAGIKTSPDEKSSDAVLTGILTVRVYADTRSHERP